MPELKPEDIFDSWIISFKKLCIQGFIRDCEKLEIWKRICKCINDNGYRVEVEDDGFYKWKFPKIEK